MSIVMFIVLFMLNVLYIAAMLDGGTSGGISVASSSEILSSDSAFFTIYGSNFGSDNLVTLTPTEGDPVGATVYNSTDSFIILKFHHLSPSNGGGSLSAQVSTSNVSSLPVPVATIVSTKPTVTFSESVLSSDSSTLTISGTGFDAGSIDENIITFTDSTSGACTNSTMTSLVIRFTHLSPSEEESILSASVTVSHTWSSTSVSVATVRLVGPQGNVTTTTTEAVTTQAVIGGAGDIWQDNTTTTTEAITTTTQATPQLSCEELYTANTSMCDVNCGSSDPYSVSPVPVDSDAVGCNQCKSFCVAKEQIQQCPRQSIGNECVGFDASTCSDPSTDCCVCNYCERQDSGYCPVRAADPPTEADCLSWFSRAGMCETHMYNDGTFCDLGTNPVALADDDGVCFCDNSNCEVPVDGGSSQTLRNVCESQTGRTESECRNINVSLTGGAYGQCAFTIDKCKDNPCTLLGDEGATCSNATDSGGNLKAMCTCSSGFVQSSYQGSDRPICEKTFCDRASTVATSIMENSFFFDCTSYIPAATYTPDDVFTTTRFSYYLGCGVLESNPNYNVTEYNVTGCCEWGETCEDCSECKPISVSSDSNIVFLTSYAQTHRLTNSTYSCQTNPLQMSSYGGPNTCALGCDVGYASTGYPPSYVCNVTNPEVKQSFACETERVCNCNHGTPAPHLTCPSNGFALCESCDSGYFLQSRDRDCRLLTDVFDATANRTCTYETIFETRTGVQSTEWCAQECDATLGCEAFSFVYHGLSEYSCTLHNNTCTNNLSNMTLFQSDTTLYTIKTRSCYCENGNAKQSGCFVNGEELCDGACPAHFDGYNDFCVSNMWHGTFHIYEDKNCNFDSAPMVFEREATPWDPYGVTLSVSECMQICSSYPSCDTITRFVDGSKCVGYSYADTCSDPFTSVYTDMIRMYRNCSQIMNMSNAQVVRGVLRGSFSHIPQILRVSTDTALFLGYAVDRHDDTDRHDARTQVLSCKDFDIHGSYCLGKLSEYPGANITFFDSCGPSSQSASDDDGTDDGTTTSSDDVNITQYYNWLCPNGYVPHDFNESNHTCGFFSDNNRCASDYCCICGECRETCLSTDPLPFSNHTNLSAEDLRMDYTDFFKYYARAGGCYEFLPQSAEDSFFGTHIMNCSTLTDDVEMCRMLSNGTFSTSSGDGESGIILTSVMYNHMSIFTELSQYSEQPCDDEECRNALGQAAFLGLFDMLDYCTAYGKSDVDSTYSCNPINSSSSSLPPNVVLDTSTNASWVNLDDLSHLTDLFGPMPDDMDGSEFPPQNLTDYVILPACTEGAVLSSLALGSYCGLNCAEGYEPNVTAPEITFIGDRDNGRRLMDKTKVHGRLICDSNSKDVKADLTCVEMACPAIVYDNATAQVMGPTQDAFGCESGLQLQRDQNCTVRCTGPYQMTGTGVVTCKPDATLDWGGTSCIPSCSTYVMPTGFEGYGGQDACYDGVVLNSQSNSFCYVQCMAGYHVNGQSQSYGSVVCTFQDGISTVTQTLAQCVERTCSDSDGLGTPVDCSAGQDDTQAYCDDGNVGDGYKCMCPVHAEGNVVYNGPTSCTNVSCAALDFPSNVLGDGTSTQCENGHVLSRGSSCTVKCDSKLGYVPSIFTLSCSSDAHQNDSVVIPQCIGMPCNVTLPLNAAIGSCPSILASGDSCTPTCDDGYVQQGQNLQLVCERGVITSNIVCEPIPEEEEGTVVLAPFVIPMTIWTVNEAEEDGGGGGGAGDSGDDSGDDTTCNAPSIDTNSEIALRSTVSSFVGVNPDDVENLYFSCDENTPSTRRRRMSTRPEYFLHFTIKLKSDGVVETVQQTIQNATVPTSNGTSSAFLDAYDEFIVSTVGPTWQMYVLTDDEGDVLLDLDHVREVGVSMQQLELVHAAFNNHTDPNTGQMFLPDPNSVYCAKFYDNVLWFLTGHERLSPQDPIPTDLSLICNRSKDDHVVEISAVVDVDSAESEPTSRQSSTGDTSSSSSGTDHTMIIITTTVCGTVFIVASLGYFAFSAKIAKDMELANRKTQLSSITVKRAQRERIVEAHQNELNELADDTKRRTYGGFLKAWDIDPNNVHEWKRHLLNEGEMGPTFYGFYDYMKRDEEDHFKKRNFDRVQVLLKGLRVSSTRDTSLLPSISSSSKIDENLNETNKYEVEIDLEMLYKVHEISRHNNFVYIFGAMRSLTPEKGCSWFLVSEELEGNETLQKVTWNPAQEQYPSWFERAHWCKDLSDAIKHLHLNGLIHGNLKSSNCVLYKEMKSKSGTEMTDSPTITENKALTDWENREFRRVRLTDLSYIRKIVHEDVKSISELKQKMTKLGKELKDMSYLGEDPIYQNKKLLYRSYQNQMNRMIENKIDDDTASTPDTSLLHQRKRLPSMTPSGLRFWHARSKKTLNLNADIKSENDLLGTPLSKFIDGTKEFARRTKWHPWLAPEIMFASMDHESATQQSDMYSLGIVLNEIMTLRKPFEDLAWDKDTKEGLSARHNIRRKVMTGARPSTKQHAYDKKAPKIISRLVRKLFRERPSDRPTIHLIVDHFEDLRQNIKLQMLNEYADARNLTESQKSSTYLQSFLGHVWSSKSNNDTAATYEMTELSTEQYLAEHSKSKTRVQDIDEKYSDEETKSFDVVDIFDDDLPTTRAPSPPLEIRPSSDHSMKPLGSSEPSILSKSLELPPGVDLASRKPADVILDRMAVAIATHHDDKDNIIDENST